MSGHGWNAFADERLPWFENGRPTIDAIQAVQILQSADQDGLDPDDYQASALARIVDDARRGTRQSSESESEHSALMTQAMEQFISDLHFGRLDPRDLYPSFKVPPKQLDPAAYLRQALAGHALAPAIRNVAPQLPLYANLRQTLANYRELAKLPAMQQRLPQLPANKLAPGQSYAGVDLLAQKLLALGDMAIAETAGADYKGAVVDGVKAFQIRHGLGGDGIIGKGTFTELNTPLAERIHQIELTLERLRWTPLLMSDRMIVVNIPEFVLRAYGTKDGAPGISMNVIVGQALNRQTPLIVENLRYIEFSPYWNIPTSIAKAEVLPRLHRDPAYFNQQGLEFVGKEGQVVTELSSANLDAVMRGTMRIRQRPGPANALGDIKFIFPNNDDIYLHHTPAVALFARQRRDFSHGCIRVEDPVALAKFVLQDQPEWTEQRIRSAMDRGKSATLRLKEPLPVVIAYATVIVKKDHKVYFFNDIYGNDKILDAALRKQGSSRRSARQKALSLPN
ncbi:L,D-transpeptidase catalytic domain protein [Collimonas arenae]|uniref:L,D-transpeptidase catalytic domain protein n=1 Tax=Collimonas arenae TaxID=279058 RepID=A0A127PR83_9BURK|nr:L,D-transpeptidase catalytic domain protein [Collimonas arenae]AMP10036.1 L,D-transpeptidase catalytic domain protein [Collimonas arenae]